MEDKATLNLKAAWYILLLIDTTLFIYKLLVLREVLFQNSNPVTSLANNKHTTQNTNPNLILRIDEQRPFARVLEDAGVISVDVIHRQLEQFPFLDLDRIAENSGNAIVLLNRKSGFDR
jgi:hypothetical protein